MAGLYSLAMVIESRRLHVVYAEGNFVIWRLTALRHWPRFIIDMVALACHKVRLSRVSFLLRCDPLLGLIC